MYESSSICDNDDDEDRKNPWVSHPTSGTSATVSFQLLSHTKSVGRKSGGGCPPAAAVHHC